LVTGCDRKYFLMTCLLLDTLRRWAPDFPVYVLDFGMDEAQRRFLSEQSTVLNRPPSLSQNLHPFQLKAAMARYLQPVNWTAMAWVDCDMIAVGPLGESLTASLRNLVSRSGEVAICRDILPSVADLFLKKLNFGPFARLLEQNKISPTAPYYNTGLFLCASPAFLDAWADLAAATPMHVNFDQNLFNLLIYTRGVSILELDARIWNVHGELLAAATVTGDSGSPTLMAGAGPALILHPTSSRGEDTTSLGAVETKKGWLHGSIALCRNPSLAALQHAVMAKYVARMGDKFARAGLTLPMNLSA
jgi:hypothetical protein